MNFDVHPEARSSINTIAANALSSMEKLQIVEKGKQSNPWWVPDDIPRITDEDMVEDPVAWLPQTNGNTAFAFMFQGGECFGLSGDNYRKLEQLCGALLKVKWVQKTASEQYIIDKFVTWARARYQQNIYVEFLDHFIEACGQDIIEQTVWAPVQHLAIEQEFSFGSTRIVPLDNAFFTTLKEGAIARSPEHANDISQFVEKIRVKMRGCSAIVVNILAEPQYAQAAASQICDEAIGLLRFFCKASYGSSFMSPVSLLGTLSIPEQHLLLGDPKDGLSYTRKSKMKLADYWRISKADINSLTKMGLADVGGLIEADDLDDFGRAVRSSILAFTRAITFTDLSDRLVFAFSAIEGLMLRNQSEAIQQNVGERVAFLISRKSTERQAIVENFRKAYSMRSQYIHHRVSQIDAEELDMAFFNIRTALSYAVSNLKNFKKRDDFISAIEHRKFGG